MFIWKILQYRNVECKYIVFTGRPGSLQRMGLLCASTLSNFVSKSEGLGDGTAGVDGLEKISEI